MTIPYPQTSGTPKWTVQNCRDIADAINSGRTTSGYIAYPYTYLVRDLGSGIYDAVDSTGNVMYGGADNTGSVDGTDIDAVITAALSAIGTFGCLVLQGALTISDTITLNIDTHPGLSVYFEKITQTETDKTVFDIVGTYVNWSGRLIGGEIRTPGGYTVPAIDVKGVINGKIDIFKSWCATDAVYGGAGSTGIRLYSPDSSQVVYYMDIKITLIGGYEKSFLLQSETNGYVNHNWIRHSVAQRFKYGFITDCNGSNVGRNIFLDCRADGSGNSGNSPYYGFWMEDDGNRMVECQTLDFGVGEVDIYCNVADSGSRYLYVNGGALSRGNITIVNSGRLKITSPIHNFVTETSGVWTAVANGDNKNFATPLAGSPDQIFLTCTGGATSPGDVWVRAYDNTYVKVGVETGTPNIYYKAVYIP